MSVAKYKMFIGGEWVDSESGESYDIINPANSSVIAHVAKGDRTDARAAIEAARIAFDRGPWSTTTPAERAAILLKLADLVEQNADKLAKLESMNVGKTLKYARNSDIPAIVDDLRFFAGAARMLEGKAAAEYSGLGVSFVKREPVGVVAAIVPWNYPLLIAVWKFAPAIAAGNTLVIKPASATPLTLLEFAKLADEAGLPRGVLNVITGPGETVGEELASNSKVDMIAMTGETSTGKKIMCAASSNVKRVHLELGGKAPMIVLPDADLEAAAEGAVVGGFWNSGQDCTAVTRVYVHEAVHDNFVKMLVERAKRFRLGDPLDAKTDVGPLASEKQRERVEDYIRCGIGQGARIAFGGKRPSGAEFEKGFFIEPTVFTHVGQHAKICQEEIFGPVITVIGYSTVDEVIKKANDVVYGLAASVWGRDITTAMNVASKLNFGTVWINDHGVFLSEMPHGGFKQSGFGKDNSVYSLEEYTRIKHVYIDQTGAARKPWHWTVYGEK